MKITEVLSVIELYRMNEIKILCKYVKKIENLAKSKCSACLFESLMHECMLQWVIKLNNFFNEATEIIKNELKTFDMIDLQNLDEKLKSHGFNIFEMIYRELYDFSDKEVEDILRS